MDRFQAFGILNVAFFDTALAMAVTSKGSAGGFRMRGALGRVFSSELTGSVAIVPENKQQPVLVQGSSQRVLRLAGGA